MNPNTNTSPNQPRYPSDSPNPAHSSPASRSSHTSQPFETSYASGNKDTKNPSSTEPTTQTQPLTGERPPSDPRSIPGRDACPPWPSAERIAQIKAEAEVRRAAFLAQRLKERMAQSKSPLDDLPADRQQTLYELLQDNPSTIVCEMLAQPEPLGWNLEIGTSSLKRFRKRYAKQIEAEERAEAAADAKKVIAEHSAGDPEFLDATQRLIKVRLFKSASNPESETRDLAQLFRIIDRHRRTNLAERKHAT